MKFIYTVWFCDPRLALDDQDREWPACFIVDATTASDAARWGDRLATKYSAEQGQQMLKSSAEPLESADLPDTQSLPLIQYGQEASDEEIGW